MKKLFRKLTRRAYSFFLSLIRERIEVRVLPHPALRLRRSLLGHQGEKEYSITAQLATGWFLKSLSIFAAVVLICGNAAALEKLTCAIHLHTYFGGESKFTFDDLARDAAAENIDVVIPTDHSLSRAEYGIPPFRNLIKVCHTRPSILTFGPGTILSELKKTQDKYKNIIFIPGTEVTASYYWTGNPFGKNLTLNQWHKHILVVGLENPGDYENLPILDNKSAGTHSSTGKFDPLLLWPLILIIIAVLIKRRALLKFCLIAFSVFSLINNYPFKAGELNPYSGDPGEKPYQALIDYANERGALTFWAHPDAPNWEKPVITGNANLRTASYADSIVKTRDYTGFAVYSEGYRKAGGPEGYWDAALMEYCNGSREKPVWAIGELDYGEASFPMNAILNILWCKERSKKGAFNALKNGSFYVRSRSQKEWALALDDFKLTSGPNKGIFGATVEFSGPPRVDFTISASNKTGLPVKIKIIRDAKFVKLLEMRAPGRFIYEDTGNLSPGMHYYRAVIEQQLGNIIMTNPVFLKK